jgi:chromosome transmission fidelity protein 1
MGVLSRKEYARIVGLHLVNDKKEEQNGDDETEFLLDEYHSDEEGEKDGSARPAAGESNLSPEVLKMLQQMAPQAAAEKEEDEPDEIKVRNTQGCSNSQIFYASRTHSQLSQFVGELGRPHFPPTYPDPSIKDELVKHIPLASRKQLCINPAVSRLSSQTAINERCLELQKKSSKQRCEFKLNLNDSTDTVRQRDFRDHALVFTFSSYLI